MRLNELLGDVDVIGTRGRPGDAEVGSVAFDSRRVEAGALFCCVPGTTTDGHRFAADAVAAGAVALLVERFLDLDVPQIRVAEGGVRPAMAQVSAAFFGYPSRRLAMVGVTGTNGKTTVTYLVLSILAAAGTPAGAIGTLTGERTTPESPDLQATLADFRLRGRQAVAMEVSSHALTQHRVDGIVFDVAAFTNLSHDHLDHHQSMEAYFAAKASLFVPDRTRLAVVNLDDPWGERLVRQLAGAPVPVPVTVVRRSDASDVELTVGSSSFTWHGHPVTLPLSGAFNVDNALMAAAIATGLGVGEPAIVAGLAAATPPPGRMEVVTPGPPFAVLVDFAHTPGRAGGGPGFRAPDGRIGPRRVHVRGRWRPGSRETADDGGGGRPAGRRGRPHLRQSAVGGPAGDHRPGPRRHRPRRRAGGRARPVDGHRPYGGSRPDR